MSLQRSGQVQLITESGDQAGDLNASGLVRSSRRMRRARRRRLESLTRMRSVPEVTRTRNGGVRPRHP